MLNSNQKGFSLLEVVIALVVTTIALLGLASAQLKSLQFLTNSFHYTSSVIQANNVIEKIWPHLCELQHTNPELYKDANFIAGLQPQTNNYHLTLPEKFSNDLIIEITWDDERLTDNLENRVVLSGNFPTLPSSCSL